MLIEPDELWIAHYSASSWRDDELWTVFFTKAQEILGSLVTRLDTNDPVRRKVRKFNEIGPYITEFKSKDNVRYTLGEFSDIGISFQVKIYKEEGDSPNSFKWYIPVAKLSELGGISKVLSLFETGNSILNTFYSYSDTITEVSKKRKPTGAVNLQRELPGIFWLNYFNKTYVDFYGKSQLEKVNSVLPAEISSYKNGSLTIKLSDIPLNCINNARGISEKAIGQHFFVDPQDFSQKPEGKFALLLSQLR